MSRVCMPLAAIAMAIVAAPTDAAERPALNRLAGPVSAEVLRVIDGDTIEVRAHIWLGHQVHLAVGAIESHLFSAW